MILMTLALPFVGGVVCLFGAELVRRLDRRYLRRMHMDDDDG